MVLRVIYEYTDALFQMTSTDIARTLYSALPVTSEASQQTSFTSGFLGPNIFKVIRIIMVGYKCGMISLVRNQNRRRRKSLQPCHYQSISLPHMPAVVLGFATINIAAI